MVWKCFPGITNFLWGESTGEGVTGGFPSQGASSVELWCSPEHVIEQTGELPVFWNALTLTWHNCKRWGSEFIPIEETSSWKFYPAAQIFINSKLFCDRWTFTTISLLSKCYHQIYWSSIFNTIQTFNQHITMMSYERHDVSNHQPPDYFLDRLFRRRSKKTSKLCITGLCVGNSLVTGEFPLHKGPVTPKVFSFDDVMNLHEKLIFLPSCCALTRELMEGSMSIPL